LKIIIATREGQKPRSGFHPDASLSWAGIHTPRFPAEYPFVLPLSTASGQSMRVLKTLFTKWPGFSHQPTGQEVLVE